MTEDKPSIRELMRDGRQIDEALRLAAVDTVIRARKLGHKLIVWKDGAVAEVDPFEIELNEDSQDANS
jgi:hypothetical protein